MKKFINIHTILLLVLLLTIAGLTYRFYTWGHVIDRSILDEDNGEELRDVLDLILPVMDKDGNIVEREDPDGVTTIVCFGNAPFADDRGSKDNLANLIAAKTGATVYNCALGDSYLAAVNDTLKVSKYPYDAYNFYWLAQVACKTDIYYRLDKANEVLGEDADPFSREVYDTLWNLDFENVDVITIMYDASDYLAGHEMYNDDNPTDIEQFTGNLEAGILLLQEHYPWIRFIVMSPAYAFAIDQSGNYVSSDQYTYGWDVLSTYAIKQQEVCFDTDVTFIDHIYGTIHEDNAKEYLTDHLHLNKAGREKVADRFVYALNYYNDKD